MALTLRAKKTLNIVGTFGELHFKIVPLLRCVQIDQENDPVVRNKQQIIPMLPFTLLIHSLKYWDRKR